MKGIIRIDSSKRCGHIALLLAWLFASFATAQAAPLHQADPAAQCACM